MSEHVCLLDRTSPKGEEFIGRCRYCKREGLRPNNTGDAVCAQFAKPASEGLLESLRTQEDAGHGRDGV